MTVNELPEPGDPPEDIDPKLMRLLAWFINHNAELAAAHGVDRIVLAPHDTNRPPELKSDEIKFKFWLVKNPPQI